MDIGCTKGVSGFPNKILKTFCANRDPKAFELITYLVNFILRGWVSDKDWDLIKYYQRNKFGQKAISKMTLMIGDQFVLD